MTDAPIILSQLGRTRETASANAESRPLVFLGVGALAAGGVAGAIATAVVDHQGDLQALIIWAVVVTAFAAAGMAATVRRPSEPLGPLVVVGAFLGATAVCADAVIARHSHGVASSAAFVSVAHLAGPVALALLPVVAMHVLLGLPDGSCRLRRAVAGGYAIGLAVGLSVWAFRPAFPLWPFGVELLVALPVGLFGTQHRYARSRGRERQRLQWFGWAVTIGMEVLVVAGVLRLLWGWPTRLPLVVGLACLPVAVGVAFGSSSRAGRINRMLTYTVSLAALTAVVLVVYLAVVVVGLGHSPSRAERSLAGLSVGAAALSALLYEPVRKRLTLYSNRLVYGEREAPDTVLRTFRSRLSRAIPMDELLLQVAESLRKTLALKAAEVWTRSDGHLERTISVPEFPAVRMVLSDKEQTVTAQAGVTGSAWAEVWLPKLLNGREDCILRVAPATYSGQLLGLIVAVATQAATSSPQTMT